LSWLIAICNVADGAQFNVASRRVAVAVAGEVSDVDEAPSFRPQEGSRRTPALAAPADVQTVINASAL